MGIPDGTIGRTLFAMQFLGLVAEAGLITEALRAMHTSTDEEYKAILSGLIRDSYKDVFSVVDPSEDTQDKILNVFRRYTPGSQRERMVAFFLGMCREAGIPTLDVPKARAMGTGRAAKQPALRLAATKRSARAEKPQVSHQQHVIGDIDPALEGLVRSLPQPGTALSALRRKQWLIMADATLKFVYPEAETSEVAKDNGAEGEIATEQDGA
jgi:hypothetical protein